MSKCLKDEIDDALFFDTGELAKAMKCSERHITNLRRRGEIPQPVKLGSLTRWPRRQMEQWIEAGCPAIAL